LEKGSFALYPIQTCREHIALEWHRQK